MTDTFTHDDYKAFHDAIKRNDVDAVRSMLGNGVDLDAICNGVTALYLAAQENSPDLIDMLLLSGANPNKVLPVDPQRPLSNYSTALNVASVMGHLDCVNRLLDAGGDPRIPAPSGRTAAHLLIEGAFFGSPGSERVDAVCSLLASMLESGVDVNHPDNDGMTLLYEAVLVNAPRQVFGLLLDRGANPLQAMYEGTTPFHCACSREAPDSVQAMLDHGVDVNARNRAGDHALHIVYRQEVFDVIMSASPDLDAQDAEGSTPLLRILEKWSPQSTKKNMAFQLIGSGASLDLPNLRGVTARAVIASDGLSDVQAAVAASAARNALRRKASYGRTKMNSAE